MDSTLQALNRLFQRDLEEVKKEITQYKNEENLWKTSGDINNSAGHLCLHLEGNLKYFIGNVLGGTGYERDRHREFSGDTIPRDSLLQRLNETKKIVQTTLEELDPEQLNQDFPVDVLEGTQSTRFFLMHLTTHLRYHLGQIDYHRRVVEPGITQGS